MSHDCLATDLRMLLSGILHKKSRLQYDEPSSPQLDVKLPYIVDNTCLVPLCSAIKYAANSAAVTKYLHPQYVIFGLILLDLSSYAAYSLQFPLMMAFFVLETAAAPAGIGLLPLRQQLQVVC